MQRLDPDHQIAVGNQWYVDDQFSTQLGTAGRRRIVEDRWSAFDAILRAWLEDRPIADSISVLDAGCGDGINLLGLRKLAEGNHWPLTVNGLDYNPVRLERASRICSSLVRGAVDSLPYAADSFDIVLCNQVLEHVPALETTLGEFRRVLAPDGLLIVGVPNEGCAMAYIRNHLVQRRIARTTDHVNFFTEESLIRTLAAAGFRPLLVQRETFFFPCTYINRGLSEFMVGHQIMGVLRRAFPSQAGGLIVGCRHDSTNPPLEVEMRSRPTRR